MSESFWKKEIHLFKRREKARGTVLVPWALYTEPREMADEELESLYAEVEAQAEVVVAAPAVVEPAAVASDAVESDALEVPEAPVETVPHVERYAAPPELLDPPPFPDLTPRPPIVPETVIELVPEPVAVEPDAGEPVAEPQPIIELRPVREPLPVAEPPAFEPVLPPAAVHQPEYGAPAAEPAWARYESAFVEPAAEPKPEPEPEPERWIAPWSSVDLDQVDEPEPEPAFEPEQVPVPEPLYWADPAYVPPVAEHEPEPEPEPEPFHEDDAEPVEDADAHWEPQPAAEPAATEPISPWSVVAPAEPSTGPVFPIFGAPDPEGEPDPVPDMRVEPDGVIVIGPVQPADEPKGTVDAEPEPEPEPAPVAFVAATPEPAPVVAAPEPAAEEKVPFLKREIRFGRSKSEPKVKPVKEKKVKAEKKAKGERPAKAAKPAKAPKAEKPKRVKDKRPRQSIWERNLSMPSFGGRHAALKVVGLRVGSSQLAAAHVSNNGSIELLQLARTSLRPGLVVGGEVREPDALAKEIKAFFAKSKLPSRNVRLGIASNRIGVRVLEVPAISDPKAFANAIRFRAQEVLPIPVTDAVLDHVILGEFEGDGGSKMNRVLVAFAHRDLVGRHAEACRKAGLKLAGVDLDAFALLRSIAEPREEATDPTHAIVAVAVGHERTIFAVSDGRICDFVRVLEWGGGVLDDALARALGMPIELAREAKHQLALSGDAGTPGGLTPVQVEAARAAVRSELRVLGQEIVSSLRYYQTRPGSLAIGEVLVTGGGSELPGLTEELEQIVGAPVRTGDPFSRLKVGKKVKRPAETGSYAVAIGLGIEG